MVAQTTTFAWSIPGTFTFPIRPSDRACSCSQAFTTKHHSARFRAPILAHRPIGSKQAPTPVDPPQPSNRALVVPHDRLFNSAAEKQHFVPRFFPLTCSYSISPPNLARTLLPPLFNLIPTYQRTTSAASSAPADSELSHQYSLRASLLLVQVHPWTPMINSITRGP